MNYIVTEKGVEFECSCFDLALTLDCGQAFRWARVPSRQGCAFEGYVKDTFLHISQDGSRFLLRDKGEKEFLELWKDYFDLDTDQEPILRQLCEDKYLRMAIEKYRGIRILRQDREEALISFVISQNNNIPRIKGIIGRMTELFGCFPTLEMLSEVNEEDLAPLRAGFRAKYLIDCGRRVTDGEVSLDRAAEMPLEEAKAELKKIKGVGEKVASCVLLFGFHRLDAYPVDVWMKRVNEKLYPDGLPACMKGYEGIAQQYLFHGIRNGLYDTLT